MKETLVFCLDSALVVARGRARAITSEASAAISPSVGPNACGVVERVLGDRHLESKVHPSEAPLYPYESGARRIG
jgi:hypothetical protein